MKHSERRLCCRWWNALLILALLAACAPASASTQLEEEIASFLINFIIVEEIGGTADYINNSNQPWVDAPPAANIIIHESIDQHTENLSELQNNRVPLHVWWYADGRLTEANDKSKAIEEYRQRYMAHPASHIWAWGYYTFGILSIDTLGQTAEVYVDASCGPRCGHGFHYTLERSQEGQWSIIKAERTWVS